MNIKLGMYICEASINMDMSVSFDFEVYIKRIFCWKDDVL
jgi:hypothetical protein